MTHLLWSVGLTATVAALLAGEGTMAQHVRASERFQFEERDTIRRTLQLPSGARRVEVSNISGALVVTGTTGDQVEVVAERTVRATTQAALDAARSASTPIMTESAEGVRIQGAPDRRRGCDDSMARTGWHRDRTSEVETRFEVRVPATVDLRLCTVNGETTVSGAGGLVRVDGVNGRIEARDVGGTLELRTVNGDVLADQRSHPGGASSLRSVNGDLTLWLPADTSADFSLKTTNGGLFTDFETTQLPSAAPVVDQKNGKRVYRSNRALGVRVGRGGPLVTLETLNGDISVRHR